jgi:membrane-associated phospholipid phosphatase
MQNARSNDILALADRSFLFGDYGVDTRFAMLVVWGTLAAFLVVDAVWLSFSHLTFAEENWSSVGHMWLSVALILAFCAYVASRLADEDDRSGSILRECARRVSLFGAGGLAFAMLAVLLITYCCLSTSAALPLQDAWLAELDARLGLDWPAFVTQINSNSWISWILVRSYHYTGQLLFATLAWLCISGRAERLAEFLALLCLASIGLAVGMLILPAAGAYTYHQLPQAAISNFGVEAGLWHYDLFMSLRSGAVSVINFDAPNINCLVTFPSGHTVIGIVTTYALRDRLWTFVPAAAFNAAMIVSTVPVGGHHVVDLLAGGAIVLAAVLILNLPHWLRARRAARLPSGLDGIETLTIR